MNPFSSIWEDIPAAPEKPKTTPKKERQKPDHTEAKAIFKRYTEKKLILQKYQDYAQKVAKATDGPSRTPVMPLATMGTNGGALLCDLCLKPIILESTPYYNMPVDEAWARDPNKDPKWVSYIKGGMIVYIAENGTLRIYHGYDGVRGHCCTIAMAELRQASESFVSDRSKANIVWKFIRDEFPSQTETESNALLSDIMNVMFSFDPGLGINQP